jgi:hypothetical protein
MTQRMRGGVTLNSFQHPRVGRVDSRLRENDTYGNESGTHDGNDTKAKAYFQSNGLQYPCAEDGTALWTSVRRGTAILRG